MGRSTLNPVRWLILLAIALQAMAPLAVARGGGDVSAFLCGTPNQAASAQIAASARELAVLLGEDAPSPAVPLPDHCPLCTLAAHALAPQPEQLAMPVLAGHCAPALRPVEDISRHSHGPPLGSRAPPSHT